MTGDEHKAEPHTPLTDAAKAMTGLPDRAEEAASVPSAAALEARSHARGTLVSAIREAEQDRHASFDNLRDEMAALDVEWNDRVTAAWREYDSSLNLLGLVE